VVDRIAIIGAGLMGHALAGDFARHGFEVAITDRDPARRADVRDRMRATMTPLETAGLLWGDSLDTLVSRVTPVDTAALAVQGASFVLEAVSEDLSVKRTVFKELDDICSSEVTLASNSSGLMASEISAGLTHADRVIITHYFNPPHLIPAVEVVPGPATRADVTEHAVDTLRRAGKSPVLVKREVPGFIANRLQAALVREAIALVEGGVITPEDLDTLTKTSYGRRLDILGVFEVLDFAGVDVWRDIARYLYADIASQTTPPRMLGDLAAAGRLGVKSGRGVYEWPPEAVKAAQTRRDQELIRQLQRDAATS